MSLAFRLFIYFLAFVFLFLGCQKNNIAQSYETDINEWFAQREQRLTDPGSWLSLAGLFWLQDGENTFGSDKNNALVFPEGKAADFIGSFYIMDDKVKVIFKKEVNVTIDDNLLAEATLQTDADGTASIMKSGSRTWFVIKRGDQFLIRLKDSENPAITNFSGIKRYPVSDKWRVKAHFEPYDPPKQLEIPNVLGQISYEDCPGSLLFEINGQKHRLDPIGKIGEESWFIIFSDETSGRETYGAGRFLSVEAPDSSGITYIEFNKAYNPPCAFSPYATCPLPPKQNHIPVEIKAGEKNYGHH